MCFDQRYQLHLVKPSWSSWGKQNSGFAIPHPIIHASSPCLSGGNKLFFLYQETATQLLRCHTLTDFPGHTIYNHCDQLSCCSQMTISICCSLCGPPCRQGRPSHLAILAVWLICMQTIFLALFTGRISDHFIFCSCYTGYIFWPVVRCPSYSTIHFDITDIYSQTDLAMFNDPPSLLSSLMKLKTIISIINQQGRILSWLRNKWREFHNFCPQVKSFCSIWVKGHGHWDAMSIPGLWIHYLKKSLRGFI